MIIASRKLHIQYLSFILFISFISVYYAQEQDSGKDLNIQELNNLSLTDLLNIEVTTASKFPEKQSDAPGVISVISRDEIDRFGGQSLHEILERVPGLTGSSSYMTEHFLVVPRGNQIQAASAHVLLLINGRPIRESLEGGIKSEVLATFPVQSIERIEVIKGPGSVLYGSNAFTAVINVITKQVEDNGMVFSNFMGKNDAYGSSLNLNYIKDDLKLLVSGQYNKSDDWTPHYPQNTGGETEIEQEIPNTGFGTFLQMQYRNFNLMSSYNKWQSAFIFPDRVSNSEAKWEKAFTNAGYNFNVSKKWNSSFNLTFTNSKFSTTEYPFIKRNSYDLTAEFTNFIQVSSRAKVVLGALYNRIDGEEKINISGDPVTSSSATRNDFGIYSQVEFKLTKNLNSVAGAQLNKIQDVEPNLVPRLGLIWHPTRNLTFKAIYAQAFRAPTINELSSMNPLINGNPDLEPEKVGTYDLEISYFDKQIQASINFFHTNIKHIIFQNFNPDLEQPIYDNGGSNTSYGGELEAKFYLKQNLLFLGSILLQDVKDNNELVYVAPTSSFGFKTGVSYIYNKILTVSLFDIYNGDIEQTSPSLNPGYESYNILNFYSKVQINDLLDLSNDSPLFITFQVNNIFDKEIWVPAWRRADAYSVPYKPGRRFFAGFVFEF